MLEKNLKYLPLSLFGIYFLKALIFSVSYPEAVILAVLAAASCFFLYKDSDSKIQELDKKIEVANNSLDKKLNEAVQKFELRVNEVESIKAQINALKINSLTRNGFSQAK